MSHYAFKELLINEDIDRLGRQFFDAAIGAYRRADDGYFDAIFNYNGEALPKIYPSIATLHDDCLGTACSVPSQLENFLKESGFTGFSFLAKGGVSQAVLKGHHDNGHDYAIRIGQTGMRDQRIISPFVVQPFYYWSSGQYQGAVLEVLPLMQILSTPETQPPIGQQRFVIDDNAYFALETTLTYFLNASHHQSSSPARDIGLMPDGTPVQVDPGQIQYADPVVNTTEHRIRVNFSRAHNAMRSVPYLPSNFMWFAEDGGWKQDQFFKNPFTERPRYRSFRPIT